MTAPIPLADLIALDPSSGGTKALSNPLASADLIIAVFRHDPKSISVVYGIDRLHEIVDSATPERLNVARVLLESQESEELEVLAAMVQVLKGRHDLPVASEH